MDPFSITAGVAGLLSLTIQTQQIVSKYAASIKQSFAEAKEVATELTALAAALEQLGRFIKKQGQSSGSFADSSVLFTTVKTCHKRLDSLQSTLEKFEAATESRSKRWKRSIKWPLEKEEHRQTIDAIHKCVAIFQFSLSLDGW